MSLRAARQDKWVPRNERNDSAILPGKCGPNSSHGNSCKFLLLVRFHDGRCSTEPSRMGRRLRALFWTVAIVIAAWIALWGRHLPPVPRCELEESTNYRLTGFSTDGKWLKGLPTREFDVIKYWDTQTGHRIHDLKSSNLIDESAYYC